MRDPEGESCEAALSKERLQGKLAVNQRTDAQAPPSHNMLKPWQGFDHVYLKDYAKTTRMPEGPSTLLLDCQKYMRNKRELNK